ncbi:MAG TPA: carbohydrate ABC transporter substrate-binding protein, partial [Actinoplanes sp.]|nr:carbohydrate ABC transporter substrate-binding protein [Actinoplanes sp.]
MKLLAGVGALMAASLLAGCADTQSITPQLIERGATVTLTINVFGDLGYKDLYARYEATHPGVAIKENVTEPFQHHSNLYGHLLAGSGTADIEAIEAEQIAAFEPFGAAFVDFLDHGVTKDRWVESTWRPATSADGTSLFGLGADLGGLALAYRT